MRGARVSSGLSPFLGWIVCVSCPVAVAIVYFESCLRFSRSGSFALLFIVRGRRLCVCVCACVCVCVCVWGGFAFHPFLSSVLVYFLVNISLKFMFRWKAVVGGLGNNCCRLLFYAVPSFVFRCTPCHCW